MKTLKQIREASGGKEAYQKFFNSILKKFGVSSPSELEGKKKKDFFDAIDKGWEGDNEPKEKGESVKEAKLKGGRGKTEIDINWDGSAKDKKFAETKYKIKIKTHRDGAMISGDKQKILAYLQGQDYGMDDMDIEDLYPEILETYDDPDDLDPDTTHNPDEGPLATGKSLGEVKAGKRNKKENSDDFKDDDDVSDNRGNYTLKGEKAGKKLSSIRVAEISGTYDEGKNYPVMDQGQRVKIIKIAKKHSGNMQKALKLIDKIRKGLSDNPDVMDILKKANEAHEVGTDKYKKHAKKVTPGQNEASRFSRELRGHAKEIFQKTLELISKERIRGDRDQAAAVDRIDGANLLNGHDKRLIIKALAYESVQHEAVDCDARLMGFKAAIRRKEGEKQKGRVIVDRRTKGAKAAALRSEKAKAKREEKRKQKEFAEKYPKLDYQYGNDAELEDILHDSNKKLYGETAANSISTGNVDMAPNAGKKKKDKVIKRSDY